MVSKSLSGCMSKALGLQTLKGAVFVIVESSRKGMKSQTKGNEEPD